MLAVVFVALVGAAARMTLGGSPDRPTAGPAYRERSGRLLAAAPLLAGLGPVRCSGSGSRAGSTS